MPDLVEIAIPFIILLFSLTVHEAAHAAMSTLCGDDTAQLQGRLTLNPISHIDLFGTIIIPIMMISMTGFMFGWAKPVPFNPRNLGNIRRDPVLIAIAGPLSNVALAVVTLIVARVFFFVSGGIESVPQSVLFFFYMMVLLNIILFLFNLIPVPPLDGHYVLNYFLPPAGQRVMQQIGPFGIVIAILLAQPLFRVVLPRVQDLIVIAFGG